MRTYYAHSIQGAQDTRGWQLLRDHLTRVADLAQEFARDGHPGDLGFAAAAWAAGLLHDLGKYRPEFQEMIDPVIRRPRGESTRHKQAGAAYAAYMLRGRTDLAFAIGGHHGGLADKVAVNKLIDGPGGRDVAEKVWSAAVTDCPALADLGGKVGRLLIPDALSFDLHVRLLFSCLVDADWLDTSEFDLRSRNLPPVPRGPTLNPSERLANVLAFIAERAGKCRDPRVAQLRAEVLVASLKAARNSLESGLFSMTVPTGGGKTLSALAFALAHAEKHDLRRIIYVAPYLSILDQNASIIRTALGAENEKRFVLEHHSLSEPGSQGLQESTGADRLAENWDVPVVVTTSVQFYESLFAASPGRCRKIHNLARSVVILDECQTLPPGLVAPTCQMLEAVSRAARCSILLCTATQPAWRFSEDLPQGLRKVTEVIPEELRLFDRLRRVRVTHWPKREEPAWDWDTVAARMLEHPQALCVVNTKAAARELFGKIREKEGAVHLSTSMCPAHRLMVLEEVRDRLQKGSPCRLVSTQLIEAGVDVDFPLLLRELAPLEALVQAAGRCNREGLLNSADGTPGGEVIVFRSLEEKLPQDFWYRSGVATLKCHFLEMGREPDLHDRGHLREYFRQLYANGNPDEHDIQKLRNAQQFDEVSRRYRLISENTTSVVVTQWTPAKLLVDRLLKRLRWRPSRALFRALGRYQVNLFDSDRRTLAGYIREDQATGVSVCDATYDDRIGLSPDAPPPVLMY